MNNIEKFKNLIEVHFSLSSSFFGMRIQTRHSGTALFERASIVVAMRHSGIIAWQLASRSGFWSKSENICSKE
jgi:hypothetical protein